MLRMAAFHMLSASVNDRLLTVQVLNREITFLLHRCTHTSTVWCAGSGWQVARGSKLHGYSPQACML